MSAKATQTPAGGVAVVVVVDEDNSVHGGDAYSPNNGNKLPSGCPTAKLLATVLDGASERAVLLSREGTVLHMNDAAKLFLCHKSSLHVTDFLADSTVDNWKTIQKSRIVMTTSTSPDAFTTRTTRTARAIHMAKLDPCSCCNETYHRAYICSKHERVREMVDHALDPVLTIDESGIMCTVNPAATELFGYTEDEMVGNNISMICGGGHAPNHDQYIQNYLSTGIKTMIGKKRQVSCRKRNGTEFPAELGLQEISDVSSGKRYFCGYLKDLSLIKKQQAELIEKQALAQAMINASFDSMLEISEAGIIQLVNNAACNMFGYTREEFLGSNISIICGRDDAKKHSQYMQRYLQTGEKRIIGRKRQVQARRKDGSQLTVELAVQEVTLSTGQKAFCGYLRDMSQQLKDKRALRKQQQIIHGKFFGKEDGES